MKPIEQLNADTALAAISRVVMALRFSPLHAEQRKLLREQLTQLLEIYDAAAGEISSDPT